MASVLGVIQHLYICNLEQSCVTFNLTWLLCVRRVKDLATNGFVKVVKEHVTMTIKFSINDALAGHNCLQCAKECTS